MPDKPLTVLTYAASASLAAIALVYLFNPNYLIDGERPGGTAPPRKKGLVGLSQPMNPSLINSVLQSLAGLRDLRLYLVRELHRRKRDGPEVYRTLPERKADEKPADVRKTLSLQSGEVTQGLKEMIDRLNERPIYRKTITATAFIRVLEHAFDTRISKAQQDAQELLQIVAERLCDEYHAAEAARKRAQEVSNESVGESQDTFLDLDSQTEEEDNEFDDEEVEEPAQAAREGKPRLPIPEEPPSQSDVTEESGFPLEGRTESRIECQHCHFKPKPSPMPFVTLTLSVPQKSSTTLDECFDVHFKTEIIEDYKCDRCRLDHALSVFQNDLAQAKSKSAAESAHTNIRAVERALADDPEKPPPGITLPDSKLAPARRIERHVAITSFPRILIIHLSRSIFEARSASAKNMARVVFPERLAVGGLLDRHRYRLLGVVTHKGTHNSGHYESFRRQHIYAPLSTPHTPPPPQIPRHQSSDRDPASETLRRPAASPVPSDNTTEDASRTPNFVEALAPVEQVSAPTTPSSSPSLLASERPSSSSTRPSSTSIRSKRASLRSPLSSSTTTPTVSSPKAPSLPSSPPPSAKAAPTPSVPTTLTPTPEDAHGRRDSSATQRALGLVDSVRPRARRKKGPEAGDAGRWWRISDDTVRECRTAEVLGMQKEVYLLFYEMEREEGKTG